MEIWPTAVRRALKTGADKEILTVYPYRSAVPKTLWRDLITGSTRRMCFGGYTNYFLWLEGGKGSAHGRDADQHRA